MQIESLITDLAFILLLGAVVTILFKWIKQPVVLGYILAGFLASPHFEYIPSVTTEENIDFWAEIGIIVLLFSLGLEFSFKKLKNSGGSAAVTALVIIVGMMSLGTLVGHAMGFSSINCLFLGAMLSMSSTTIIIKAFTDLGLRQKKFTSLVLSVLIVEDLFAVVMMVLLSSIAINKTVESTELLMSVSKLVFFLVIWFLVGIYILPSLFRAWRRFLNSETLLVVSMGLCLGMAVFSVYCGFSLALGAFVMGSILAGTSFAERIEHVVMPVKDLFGAVFFISVGMMVQPQIITEYWGSILTLSVVVVVGMIVFGTFGMLITGQPLKVAMESGFSLTQIGEFAFIIATLGMNLGVLNTSIYPIVVAVSVLTTFGTPYFIKMAPGAYSFVEKHLPSRLHFLIDRYQEEATRSNATQNAWVVILKRTLGRTLLYSIILIAISVVARVYLLPWLDRLIPRWSHIVCLTVTLVVMAPFLAALIMPLTKKRDDADGGNVRGNTTVPRLVTLILRCIIALMFVVYNVSWTVNFVTGASIGIGVVVLSFAVFSRNVKKQMMRIEEKFIANLNERELRRSGKNNMVVNDLHMAYMTVGNASRLAGQQLYETDLRKDFGVNVVNIQRGQQLISVPSAKERIYPGDVLCVIGTDKQIEDTLKVVEVNDNNPSTSNPEDFKLTSILLSESSPLLNRTPVTANLRNKYGVLVVAVQRGDSYIDSDPHLKFQAGDIVWLVGDRANLSALQ